MFQTVVITSTVGHPHIISLISKNKSYRIIPSICDPIASKENVLKEYKIEIENDIPEDSKFDVVIVAVAHNVFKKISINRFLKPKNIIFDVKEVFGKGNFDRSL